MFHLSVVCFHPLYIMHLNIRSPNNYSVLFPTPFSSNSPICLLDTNGSPWLILRNEQSYSDRKWYAVTRSQRRYHIFVDGWQIYPKAVFLLCLVRSFEITLVNPLGRKQGSSSFIQGNWYCNNLSRLKLLIFMKNCDVKAKIKNFFAKKQNLSTQFIATLRVCLKR